MNIGIVIFLGTTCDRETKHWLQDHTTINIWFDDEKIYDLDWLILPGGFSYNDQISVGKLAAQQQIFHNIPHYLLSNTKILGICNGFQMLCSAGFLIGTFQKQPHFINTLTTLNFAHNNIFFKMPIACQVGKYVVHNDYTDISNNIFCTYSQENPTNSQYKIAGMKNDNNSIFGLIPHPERTNMTFTELLEIIKNIV